MRPEVVAVEVLRSEVPVQLPHVFPPAQDLTDEAFHRGQGGCAVPIGLFGGVYGVQRVQHAEIERNRQQRVRHRPVVAEHGVLIAAEQRQSMLDELRQCFLCFAWRHREQSGSVGTDRIEAHLVEVASHLRVDVVLNRPEGRRDRQNTVALGRRLPIVGIEVPAATDWLGALHQDPEPAALLAVEILHPKTAAAPAVFLARPVPELRSR